MNEKVLWECKNPLHERFSATLRNVILIKVIGVPHATRSAAAFTLQSRRYLERQLKAFWRNAASK